MSRVPSVTLENQAEVTRHYSEVGQNRELMASVFRWSARLFPVETHYEEGVEAEVRDHINSGGQLLIAHKHISFFDPLMLASMVETEPALQEIKERGVAIPARSSLFNAPIYGGVVRNSGVAVPVFLKKDFEGASDEVREAANQSLVDIVVARMNRGEHGAIYPEGSRNRKNREDFVGKALRLKQRSDPTELVTPLRHGIGQIASKLARPENVKMLPIATVIGSGMLGVRHAISFVGETFDPGSKRTPEEITEQMAHYLQDALDQAAIIAGLKDA